MIRQVADQSPEPGSACARATRISGEALDPVRTRGTRDDVDQRSAILAVGLAGS